MSPTDVTIVMTPVINVTVLTQRHGTDLAAVQDLRCTPVVEAGTIAVLTIRDI